MNLPAWIQVLARDGDQLVLVTTLVLALAGLLAWAFRRSPHRQYRLGELGLTVSVLWAFLALLPLPRVGFAPTPREPSEVSSVTSSRGESPTVSEDTSRAVLPRGPASEEPVTIPNPARPPIEPAVLPLARDEERLVDGVPARLGLSSPEPSTAEKSASTSEPTFPSDLLVWVYLVGAALVVATFLAAWARWRLWVRAASEAPPWMIHLVRERFGGKVRVGLHPSLQRPLVGGLLRANILLPESLARPGQERVARYVLLHECGHVAHGDVAGRWLHALGSVFFWFHPLYWFTLRRVRFASEVLADAYAIRHVEATEYAREILTLAEGRQRHGFGGFFFPTLFTGRSDFYRRMTMILRSEMIPLPHSGRRARLGRTLLVLGLAGVTGSFFGIREAAAQDPAETARLRDEVTKLQAERDAMRAEIQQLKDVVAQLRGATQMHRRDEARAERVRLEGQREVLRRRLAELNSNPPPRAFKESIERHEEAQSVSRGLEVIEGEIAQLDRVIEGEDAEVETLSGQEAKPSRELTREDLERLMAEKLAELDRQGIRTPSMVSVPVAEPREAYVLDLVARVFDMKAELDILRANIEESQPLVERGFVPQSQLRQDQIRYAALERKLEAVRLFVEVEKRATKAEIEAIRARLESLKKGPERGAEERAYMRLEGRLHLLDQVK